MEYSANAAVTAWMSGKVSDVMVDGKWFTIMLIEAYRDGSIAIEHTGTDQYEFVSDLDKVTLS